MFLENAKKAGSIEVICGSMFSGKTEELIRRLRRAQFANQKVEIYKPAIDVRYSDDQVVSHDSHSIPSTPIDSPASMLLLSSDVEVVGIDEAQFFDDTIVEVAQTLADKGIRVIVAGLDTDFTGSPRATSSWSSAKRTSTSLSAATATTKPSPPKNQSGRSWLFIRSIIHDHILFDCSSHVNKRNYIFI